MNECPNFQIGLTVATMRKFTWYGIPYPELAPYQPYAVVKRCGDSTLKGYGFPTQVLQWSSMSQAQLWNLLSLFDNDTDASADLYVYMPKDTGYQRDWATFLVKMARPVDGSGKSPVPESLNHFTGISAQLFHMQEQ
jgi:hypothetical protein